MKKINLIAADIGAGSGRVFLADFDGKKISSEEIYRFENNSVLLGGTLYWDFLNIMHELENGFRKAGSEVQGELTGIGIDTWGADFGLLDKNGDLLSNPVSYRDWRTDKVKGSIYKIVDKDKLNKLNSSLTYEYCTLFQLYYVFKFQNELAGLTDIYLPIPCLINYFLTGQKIVDPSILSGSQFYNVVDKKYRTDILEMLEIRESILPPVSEAGKVLGNLKKEFAKKSGLGPGTLVSLVCSHDTPSAVTGIPLDGSGNGGCAFINSGSWSLLGMETKRLFVSQEVFDSGFTIWNAFRDRFILLKIFNGFFFLQECKKVWDTEDHGKTTYDQFYKNIAGFPSSKALMPLDSGSLFDLDKKMPDIIRGYFKETGQAQLSSRDEIIAALLQSIVLEYRIAIAELEILSKNKLEKIYMVGGGSLNKTFCQWVSDSMGKEVFTGYPESTINGNILSQLIALGEIKGIEEGREMIRGSSNEVIYSPKKDSGIDWDSLEDKIRDLRKS
ncbi:rhamnulokinase family protein [Actinomycetota bacterium]